jgi:hypothetical protein
MAYAAAGRRPPEGDQYEIEGFDRRLVKVAFNTLLNASSRTSAIAAITQDLYEEHPNQRLCKPFRGKWASRRLAARVVSAIERKHYKIRDYFGSGCGAGFQRWDSDMAMEVMLRMVQSTGRCPLPMHDSFLVAKPDVEMLAAVMTAVAQENQLQLALKSSTGQQWTPPPPSPASPNLRPEPLSVFHMGVKTSHLRKRRRVLLSRRMPRRPENGLAQGRLHRHRGCRGSPPWNRPHLTPTRDQDCPT